FAFAEFVDGKRGHAAIKVFAVYRFYFRAFGVDEIAEHAALVIPLEADCAFRRNDPVALAWEQGIDFLRPNAKQLSQLARVSSGLDAIVLVDDAAKEG